MRVEAQLDLIVERLERRIAQPVVDQVRDAQRGDDQQIAADELPLGRGRHIELTIVAQDPEVVGTDGRIVRATVRVAADRWRPLLQTHRFHGVSYDPRNGTPGPEWKLVAADGSFTDKFAAASDKRLLSSHEFHAQNVYAIASRTLSAFETALGRRIPWGFGSHQLYLVPHGEIGANAHYSRPKRALVFGFVPGPAGESVYTCLSHDIAAHETAHAILDGLKPGYFTPSQPDQGAFHEGFADIVALLSVFALPEVIDHALADVADGGFLQPGDVTRRKLEDSVLLGLAEQFGKAVHGREGVPLRQSVRLRPGTWWRNEPEYQLVHNRGEILVAAVAQALLDMWLSRLSHLVEQGPAPRRLAADVGARTAGHLLNMVIRAVDYCPPLEFEFEDFLDAVLWADMQMAPDDEHGYRESVVRGFGRYGIARPEQRVVEVSALRRRPAYERFNFASLRTDRDEVFRFMWENDELLGISLDYYTVVESIHPSVRVGPDGFVVHETVVSYTQQVDGTVSELVELSRDPANRYAESEHVLEVPPHLSPATRLRIYGGGSIIFDQFGRPKMHLHKPLLDWERQTKRLAFLARRPEMSARGMLGAARYGREEAIAALHEPDPDAAERW